jgi:hypothetical protein
MPNALSEFGRLTPTEVAVLGASLSPEPSRELVHSANISVYSDRVHLTLPFLPRLSLERPLLIPSKRSLLLCSILAEGYTAVSGDLSTEQVFSVLDKFARGKVAEMSLHPFWERPGGMPYGGTLDLCKSLEYETQFPLPHPVSNELIGVTIEKCSDALKALSNEGLIIDPPWLNITRTGAAGLLILFLGSIPLDISVKTQKGVELVEKVSIQAKLWEFERTTSVDKSDWRFNLKIAQFVDSAMEHLARSYLRYWEENNPEAMATLRKERFRRSGSEQED